MRPRLLSMNSDSDYLQPPFQHPDFEWQFILDMEGSDIGIGAVLSQQDDEGREGVIAYGSLVLSKVEQRYCVMLQDLLAVVMFTRQYCLYLMGRCFLLLTDHMFH